MRNSRSIVNKRREKILHILNEKGFIKVSSLAGELNASPLTIRRDFDILEEAGKIYRFHGGASLPKQIAEDNIFSSSLTTHKQAIAKKAAAFVEDGDTIFINTSSTALAMLSYIKAKHVTVITNNVKAISCDKPADMILVLTGGELRVPKEAMVGDFALNNLNKVTASKCFLGCNGITVEEGVTTAVLQEATINGSMLSRAVGARYILADKTKIGRRLNFIYGTLNDINCLITDTEASQAEVDKIRKAISVVQVKPLGKPEQNSLAGD